MSKGMLVTISPNGTETKIRIESTKGATLEQLQAAVGGYIERVRVKYEGRTRNAYVNEDGISLGLEDNPYANRILAPPFDRGTTIVGNLAIFVPDKKGT